MSARKKRTSASDVLRQEMQQPLVIPAKATPLPPEQPSNSPQPTPTPTPLTATNMNAPNSDDSAAAAKLKAAQESEAKMKQEIEDLQSKLKAQKKELDDAKKNSIRLGNSEQTRS